MEIIEYPLEDGGSVLIEISDDAAAGIVPAGRPGEMPFHANITLEDALDVLQPIASSILNKLRNLHVPPTEIEVEFGLKATAKAGMIVAQASVDANYKVTLKWKSDNSM